MITEEAQTRVQLFTAGMMLVFAGGGLALLLLLRARRLRRKLARIERALAWTFLPACAFGVGCVVYGTLIEPDWVEVTFTRVQISKLSEGEKLRVVHISDLHVNHPTRALSSLPERIAALSPDVILFTGDSLNASRGLPVLRDVLGRLKAPLGTFAVRGNHDVWCCT